MTHRAEQIIDQVVELVPSTAFAVFKHRRNSLSESDQELPAISVDVGEDAPLDDDGASNIAFYDSLLTIEITAFAREADEPDLVKHLMKIRAIVHRALMADRALALDFVIDTRYGGAGAAEIQSAGDMLAGRYTSRWFVHYRMNITDPE